MNNWWIWAPGLLALLLVITWLYRNCRQQRKWQRQRIRELETEKQLAATEAVLKGEEQERGRLAQDLHDGLGGLLSGIKYSLDTMKGSVPLHSGNRLAIERSMDMLDSSIREMRRVAKHMMPETLVKFGLDTALRDCCNDIHQSGSLQVMYQSIGMEGVELEQGAAITIYRIVEELLGNILKHAGATQAIVQLSRSGHQLSITVEDDGRGFDTSILQSGQGMGWSIIRSRIGYLRGQLNVQSSPGKGSSVLIELTA